MPAATSASGSSLPSRPCGSRLSRRPHRPFARGTKGIDRCHPGIPPRHTRLPRILVPSWLRSQAPHHLSSTPNNSACYLFPSLLFPWLSRSTDIAIPHRRPRGHTHSLRLRRHPWSRAQTRVNDEPTDLPAFPFTIFPLELLYFRLVLFDPLLSIDTDAMYNTLLLRPLPA